MSEANFAQNASAAPDDGSAGSASGASPRRNAIVLGTVALLVGTLYAAWQPPRAAPLEDARLTSWSWWRYPVERNAVARLTVAGGPLRAVAASATSDSVWFAGDGGLVIMSANGGRSWVSQNLAARQQTPAPTQRPAAKSDDNDMAASIAPPSTPFRLVSNEQQSPVQNKNPAQQSPI